MSEDQVAERLAAVRERIATACARAGRSSVEVTLVGVTKRIPLPRVVAACRAGLTDLGENRIQDAIPRQAELASALITAGLAPDFIHWHFIGHLQRNKAAKAVGRFHLVHAVDSLRLAEKLSELAVRNEVSVCILVEVNLTAEPQKHGADPDETIDLVDQVARLPGLQTAGLMVMARFGAPETELRHTFAALRKLQQRAKAATGLALPHLSMGMSDDFEAAIAEGATLVRIGTAIFGPRDAG